MLFRTLSEAQKYAASEPLSWVQRVILRVTLRDGQQFFRTYAFNSSRDKCRQCRGAYRGGNRGERRKLPSTGHVCEICGNPFAGFVRQGVRRTAAGFEVLPNCWSSQGRLC